MSLDKGLGALTRLGSSSWGSRATGGSTRILVSFRPAAAAGGHGDVSKGPQGRELLPVVAERESSFAAAVWMLAAAVVVACALERMLNERRGTFDADPEGETA